jgi:cell division protein ZapE
MPTNAKRALANKTPAGSPLVWRAGSRYSKSLFADPIFMLSPFERYQLDLQKPGFSQDPQQARVVDFLQKVYENILRHRHRSLAERFRQGLDRLLRRKSTTPVRGLYLWGGVGRGKTYLMDAFFESLPFEDKLRVHFHRFMRRIHHELTELAGQPDPLRLVAERISREASVICFDEFFVADITDAMLLGNLFSKLFERGVSLVATSNIPPHQLYKDGLQRERFLPAIALIEQHTEVVHLDSQVDYRLRVLERAELYHHPLGDEAERSLADSFGKLAPEHAPQTDNVALEIEGRNILARKEAEDVVWFEFPAICDGPRSQNDYIELAKEYHTVLISNVPTFTQRNTDQARRFINLVDEFYDRNVNLVLSAAQPLETLYQGEKLAFEFQRTASRLLEMQSHEYLAREHKP